MDNEYVLEFGSVCSGIEAASVAWQPLGWRAAWFSEIEAYPSALLAYRYPSVPNLGDMRKLPAAIRAGTVKAPELLCGGTPCQSFSVAGKGESLDDERGNLTLVFCEVANAIDDVRAERGEPPCVVKWENVPGVLTTKDNAFGCFLAELAGECVPLEPPGGGRKWPDAGVVIGPRRTIAWRLLDAQYFGLAQRRERVFVVASARPGFDPAAVLFEFEGVRRDSPPSRQAYEEAAREAVGSPDLAGTLQASHCGGAHSADAAAAGQLIASPVTANAQRPDRGDGTDNLVPVQGCWWDGGQVSQTLDAVLHKGQMMPEKQRFPAVLQPVTQPIPFDTTQITNPHNRSNPQPGAPCHALAAGAHPPAIAFKPSHYTRGKDGAPSSLAPPLTKEADKGDQEAVVFAPDISPPLRAGGNSTGGDRPPGTDVDTADSSVVTVSMRVRRLMPVECERLQGFEDDYTRIPTWSGWRPMGEDETPEQCIEEGLEVRQNKKTKRWRVKDVDGPRYKAIGNSWAVNCARWIGRRIAHQLAKAAA